MLQQVAPQARIVENSSRLASKASLNILSKVLSQAASGDASDAAAAGSSHVGQSAPKKGFEDDDEDQFMATWNGLFSKGSPLVDGSATDPFKDLKDLRGRTKCVWKKNSDRPGHHSRYQKRRMQREQDEDGDAAEGEEAAESHGWQPDPNRVRPQQ